MVQIENAQILENAFPCHALWPIPHVHWGVPQAALPVRSLITDTGVYMIK